MSNTVVERLKAADRSTHALWDHLLEDAVKEIESLRREVASYQEEIKQWYGKLEAADDEVESLHLENKKMRESLKKISTGDLNYPEQAARKALKGET